MKKERYYYNTKTLRYEKVQQKIGTHLLRIFGFLCASIVFAIIFLSLAYRFLESPREKQQSTELRIKEKLISEQGKTIDQMSDVLKGLIDRDNNIYRTIFEAEPIPDEVRNGGVGGAKRYEYLKGLSNSELLTEVAEKIDKLKRGLYLQTKSYDDIAGMIRNKEKMLASIPAIQPVSNKDLTRIASGFGYRIDPVYKIKKFHEGTDFTAPTGTPIYATGDGVVKEVSYQPTGYGNHIIINHGFGYETLYGHCSSVLVKPGRKITRGQLIGKVGNTGKSTGPHCHYEVWKNGEKVDPINFFTNDLTPAEYEKMLEISRRHNQSFD